MTNYSAAVAVDYSHDGTAQPPEAEVGPDWYAMGQFTVGFIYRGGEYVAEDVDGHAYGIAPTANGALLDWWKSINERHDILSEDEDNLVPYLSRELNVLKSKLRSVYVSSAS